MHANSQSVNQKIAIVLQRKRGSHFVPNVCTSAYISRVTHVEATIYDGGCSVLRPSQKLKKA